MDAKNAILKALPKITPAIDALPSHVFTIAELRQLINDRREEWKLDGVTEHQLLKVLGKEASLQTVRLDFPYRPALRYTWGAVTVFELVQSVNAASYFSHYTAMHLHELTEQIPKTIYLNIEQPKKPGGGTLTQAGIDRAFRNKCRISTNLARYQNRSICLLNGANTGKLGVIEMAAPEGSSQIRVANIERTLIDAVVRPIYSGGLHEVASAFEAARDQASSNKIAAFLRKLNYTYPYHQSIGFYMQRAGYKASQLDIMRQFEMEFDFYLDYRMKETEYCQDWRLYVPKGFQ